MIETHPFPPYLPSGAKVLIMGTFPPQPHRWAMEFYYPNRTNDFWKIMGLIFFNDPTYLYDTRSRSFRLDLIKDLLDDKGIALHDTGREIRRLRDNASDKYLEIVTPVPLFDLLARIPLCRTIATTGEKAAGVIASITGTEIPKMGHMVTDTARNLDIWRMPSTSRAYPLPLENKAAYYATLFNAAGIEP